MTDEEFQAFFDKMSDDDLVRIETLAQKIRKRRKMKWYSSGEVFEEMRILFSERSHL